MIVEKMKKKKYETIEIVDLYCILYGVKYCRIHALEEEFGTIVLMVFFCQNIIVISISSNTLLPPKM